MVIGYWGYQNGNIPPEAMATSGGVLLKPSTAAQCDGWLAAANAHGVALKFGEGYRDLAGQEYWRTYWTNKGQPDNAARPGTSTHGYGQAVDINRDSYSDAEYQIIVDTGRTFGMILNSNESWHFADAGQITAQVADLRATPISATDPNGPDEMTEDQWAKIDAMAVAVGLIQYQLDKQIKPRIDDLAGGRGPIHAKLDQLLWIANDGASGIRQFAARIARKLGA